MAATHSDEFKHNAVRIALTSGLIRHQVGHANRQQLKSHTLAKAGYKKENPLQHLE